MIGGGRNSQIGYLHRSAALRDGTFALLAGALDIDAARGREFGAALGLAPERCYPDHASLFEAEARRPDGIQAVSIATPNSTHHAITRAPSRPACTWCARSRSASPWRRPRSSGPWRASARRWWA